MRKPPTNIQASVKQKLLNISRAKKKPFQLILLRYIQERLLYRLSVSRFESNFILKGALSFLSLEMPYLRPTKDIDLLGLRTKNDPANIKRIFAAIARIDIEDGLHFEPGDIRAEQIRDNDEYNGVRLKMGVGLGKAKTSIQVDIGFGDMILGGPVPMRFPVLLDQPQPVLRAYPKECAIAEKLHAIVHLGLRTSRVKDFFDIAFFAQNHSFELESMRSFVSATFKTRQTEIPPVLEIFPDAYMSTLTLEQQWKSFLERNELDLGFRFDEVIAKLRTFFQPICSNVSGPKTWNPEKWKWQ